MNRRVFLRGIGGVSLAAPFLHSVAEQEAKAQSTTPPKRLVIYFECNGVNMATFFPRLTASGPLTAASLSGERSSLAPA